MGNKIKKIVALLIVAMMVVGTFSAMLVNL